MNGSRLLFRCGALTVMLASACTFVNSFDEVKPLDDGSYSASAPSALPLVDGSAVDAQQPNDASRHGGGLIVVSGQVATDSGSSAVLTVLDPATGRELGARQEMVVAAIRYDGVRDLWYVLEPSSTDFQAGPLDEMVIHARSFDPNTGEWTELGSLQVPPLHSHNSVVVLRDRLLYVAHGAGMDGAVQLVTVNTADPASLSLVSSQPLDRAPRGMIGTRSSGTGAGGVAGLVRSGAGATGCEAGNCVEVVRVRVANATPAIDPPLALGPAGSGGAVPSYASFESLARQMVVLPRTSSDSTATSTALLLEPRNQQVDGPMKPFVINDSLLRPAAVSECARQLFIVGGNNDLDLHAVPMLGDGSGTPARLPTGHSGQSVYFEPTSKSVLTPFSQGDGFELAAYRLGGTPAAPSLTKRSADWNPPGDLRPILLGVREPYPIVCP